MTALDSNRLADVEAEQPGALLRDLDRLAGVDCAVCSRRLCGHEALFSIALGLKNAPRCLSCLANGMHRSASELGVQLVDYIQHRDCYRQAWDVASEREKMTPTNASSCPWSNQTTPAVTPAAPGGEVGRIGNPSHAQQAAASSPALAWDAGDMGCGDLVLELRRRLAALPPGTVLEVTARDPGAPQDLPAWCRLTGHRLVQAAHPRYLIQRKEP